MPTSAWKDKCIINRFVFWEMSQKRSSMTAAFTQRQAMESGKDKAFKDATRVRLFLERADASAD